MDTANLLSTIIHFNAQYASAIDHANWEAWMDLFVEDCSYKIQPRENFDRKMPLCTLALLSKGMLKDRVYGITNTLYHDPYYQRHIISLPMIIESNDQRVLCETNYAVFRTKFNHTSEVMNVGRYVDEFVFVNDELKIKSRNCVFDSEMISNSIIYPI
jgi:salicylate 5-hydroxylase small subunit